MMNEFDICMCANGPYLQHVLEVAFNAHALHQDSKIHMHVITDVECKIAKAYLDSFNLSNTDFILYSIKCGQLDTMLTNLSAIELTFTKMTYAKLLMFDILPKKKILYVDTDMLFYKPSLLDLFNYDISEYGIGAVDDFAVMNFDKQEMQQTQCTSYFNAGFMMIDLTSDKVASIYNKAIDIIKKHDITFYYGDQTIFNAIIQSNYVRMPVKFNFIIDHCMHPAFQKHFNYSNTKSMIEEIQLVHYAGKYYCPWKSTCIMNISNFYYTYYCSNKLKMIEYITTINKLNEYQELVKLS